MNVYTYYSPVPGLWPEDTQLKLIELWKKSWSKHGWTPRVLLEADAMRHPRYAEFKKKFWSLPSEYGHEYEGACFMRWVAMSVWGDGMLTDYDVINYGLKPQEPYSDKMVIIADKSVCIFLGSVLAPRHLYEAMCQNFLDWQPDLRDKHPHKDLYHCSDLSYVMQCMTFKNRPCPPWLVQEDGCTLYPKIDGQLVHYGYMMFHHNKWPKCDHIERVRPI